MDDIFVDNFLLTFDDRRFPGSFLEDYEALECFSQSELGETLLVKSRKTGSLSIAKCYSNKSFLTHTDESSLLKSLSHSGLPAFIGEYRCDGMLCVVREYIEGVSLDQYTAENELSLEQVSSIMIQLCDILSYLHGQALPIIHRDIKPQNIIINRKGEIHLIDFGIARAYNEASKEDTIYCGTKYFAAPEQYGFSQTDCRADIFSMGVLLGWLLTGELDYKKYEPAVKNRSLLRIIKKCTEFAPEKRYRTVSKIKSALLSAGSHKQRNAVWWTALILCCAFFLCTGFVLGRYTDIDPIFSISSGVHFQEPLIEQAVRLQLNKRESERITESDLLNVTELYIYGNQAAESFEAFEALGVRMMNKDGTVYNGGLSSLEDLKLLVNLRKLNIAMENIRDLTPLSELSGLEQLLIKHDPIKDVSPLASLPKLRELYLYNTQVSDLSSLAACYTLENIDVGDSYITSMAAFDGINNIRNLNLKQIPMETLSGIEAFTRLEQISLSYVADGDLSPLQKLPLLKEVYLGEALRRSAEESLNPAQFEIIYQ